MPKILFENSSIALNYTRPLNMMHLALDALRSFEFRVGVSTHGEVNVYEYRRVNREESPSSPSIRPHYWCAYREARFQWTVMIPRCVAAFYSCSRCLVLSLLAGYKTEKHGTGDTYAASRDQDLSID
jgi:hypothetical protein